MLLDHPGLPEADLAAVPLVRNSPHVSGPAGAGDRGDWPGHGSCSGRRRRRRSSPPWHPPITCTPTAAWPRKRFASACWTAVTVAIMDEQGMLLLAGERGEIVVRGPLVMAGDYKDTEATAEASRHGWHHTGDIGYLDSGNDLYIVDRAKDMIITGRHQRLRPRSSRPCCAFLLDCAVIGSCMSKLGPAGDRGRSSSPIPARTPLIDDIDVRQGPLGSVRRRAGRGVAGPAPLEGGQVLKNEVKSAAPARPAEAPAGLDAPAGTAAFGPPGFSGSRRP